MLTSNGVGFGEDLAAVQQRMGQEFFDDLLGAFFAGGLGGGERTGGMAPAGDGAEVGEIHVDQTGLRQQAPDAAQALGQEAVADFEAFHDAGFFIEQFEELSDWAGR